jgi:UDP-2,3-diacylglucosamine pyrophosphatase LpxH
MTIPASLIPRFDDVYIISDLHLGGPPGFQIFNSGSELTRLVESLCADTPTPPRKIALVVNGDLVDFLAERPFAYFDPSGALDKLDRIVKDETFSPVWAALRRFVNADHRRLVINLGNHDLELALPWMRARLLDVLSDGRPKARAQIDLTFDGAGFLCRVGGAEVLAVHGNEVDDWNLADYERIRGIAHGLTQRLPVDNWVPNAGAQLVIDVMNDVKGRFPFVDLLKPEVEAVLPTLVALAPDQRDKLNAIARTSGRLLIDKYRRRVGLLGADAESDPETLDSQSRGPASRTASRGPLPGEVDYASDSYANALLDRTEERLHRKVSPMALLSADERGEYLGKPAALVKFFLQAEPSEVLREALQGLGNDRTFDLTHEDATFHRLDEQIGDVDFLVAGHTHLERAMRRRNRRGWYFNSGTWARLIRLDKDVLGDASKFRAAYDAFQAGTMAALDALPDLVMRRLTVI